MANPAIKLKKSAIIGKAPLEVDLDYGEIAINYADGRLYYKSSSNVIKNFVDSDLVDSAVQRVADGKLSVSGDTMQGTLNMNFNRIINLSSPISDGDPASKIYVDNAIEAGIEGVTPDPFPTGDLGLVDSASFIDAFGIQYGAAVYDLLTDPTNTLASVDLGTDSSI